MNPASVGHQCPECVSEGRKTQRPALTAFGATRAGVHGYVTIGLIVINCAMLLISVLSTTNPGNALFGGGGLGFGGPTPFSEHTAVFGEQIHGFVGASYYTPDGVANGEYYRLITAMFTHYGLIHLAVNMYSLWILGRPLEAMLGPIRFAAVYLVCGIGGNVAAYVFSPADHSAGASTAIFGLLGVYFFVLKRLNLSASAIMPVILINLFLTFTVSGISIAGHLGGLAVGALVGYGVTHAPQSRRTQIQAGVLVGAVIVLGLITAWQTHQLNQLTAPGA